MNMFCRAMTIGLSFAIAAIPLTTFAQDRNGDYYKAPRDGRNEDYYMRAWLVVDPTPLNCRRAPGSKNPVVRQFAKGKVIFAEIGESGKLNPIVNDEQDKPWLRVTMEGDLCYVRANSQYIRPNGPGSH
ncbi:MAG TPA: hypothetical protein VK211_01125 [Kamptonema sp.]|nr:hypothetical protein [Kamptonema sp.]